MAAPHSQSSTPARDTRIDVFRALALLSVFVSHVPGTIYENLSHRNFGFSDSAEAFVLISGISAGIVYGPRFGPGRRLALSIKAWKRAGRLYVAHLATTVVSLAIFSGAALFFRHPGLLAENNIGTVIGDTPDALVGLATLGHQIGYNNILSLYFALILMLPAMLFVAERSLLLLLSLSGALWFWAGLRGVAPPNFPTAGVWFLNPLSWQFLFAIGFAGAIRAWHEGGFMIAPWLVPLAFAYLLLALLWVRIPLWGVDASFGLPMVLTGFDKTFLSLPRLLHVLALAGALIALPTVSRWTATSPRHPLAVMGRHSLPVFILGTLLAMVAQAWKGVEPQHFATDTLLVGGSVLVQFGFAYFLEWLKGIETGEKASSTPGLPPKPVRAEAWPGAAAPMLSGAPSAPSS